ncbi:MAG: hypothetical protein CL950_11995 [Erythrobacter sp.]|nr:hypothetical protein [Erythrobacter sp.]
MKPRLEELTVRDFRSIRGELVIPLNAQIVLVHGPNGAGKTSLVSALELGLTGDVAGLRRNDSKIERHLVNRDADYASINLRAGGLSRTEASFDIKAGQIRGTALLNQAGRNFFVERSYLSQSTLGRLLDIYQSPASRDQTNTPLTRFVKDLLGLDQLEALIDGLHPAGHKRRMFKLTPRLETIERLDESLKSEGSQGAAAGRERRQRIEEAQKEWADVQARFGLANDLPAALEALRDDPHHAAASIVAQNLREAQSLRTHWQSLDGESENRSAVEAAEAQSAKALEQFDAGPGRLLVRAIASLSPIFSDLPAPAASNPEEAWREAHDRAEKEIARCEANLAAAATSAAEVDSIDQRVQQLKARLEVIEGRMADFAGETAGLSDALATVLPHIHDEQCPICSRDFSEVSEESLASHVRAKIARLIDDAEEMQALGGERQSVQRQIAQFERERGQHQARTLDPSAINALQQRTAGLRASLGLLAECESSAAEGMRIRRTHSEASGRAAQLRLRDSSAREIRSQLAALCDRAAVDPLSESETTEAGLTRVVAALDAEQSKFAALRDSRQAAIEIAEELITLTNEECGSKADTSNRKARREAIATAQKEVKAIRDEANALHAAAEQARGAIVSRVFNQRLNAIWRDLFVRLAPNEPFVPAFTLPEDPKAPVNAILETIHRDGGRYGRPGAMLSAGNLNTAALTLFIALHLSVKPPFPWLILDDPVQSMDEMHIAQFAALLRTLAKAENRQVIIAVHERPLFEYLALELSPAFPDDRLITVELSRSVGGSTRCETTVMGFEPDRLVA